MELRLQHCVVDITFRILQFVETKLFGRIINVPPHQKADALDGGLGSVKGRTAAGTNQTKTTMT